MDNLNRLYNQVNNTWIGFYMKCEPTYINNSSNLHKTMAGATLLMIGNRDLGCINIHIVDQISTGTTVGVTLPPLNSSIIDRTSYTVVPTTSTLAHEIGHVLGLVHTHLFSAWHWRCFTECVSRTRTWPFFNLCPTANRFKKVCESTGDALNDTPADPNLINNNSCAYTLGGTDPWGDAYPSNGSEMPETANIMSYNADDNCINHFSRLQIAVMLRTIKWSKPDYNYWKDTRYTFDSYEPDNSYEIARSIVLNEIQEHNFHQQYNNNGGIPNTTQCDVDWVRFTPTCSMNYDVQTFAIAGRTNANTRLTIFDANLNQLAQNDDISSSNQFSKITMSLVAGQTYFFKIENMSANLTGYYSLSINPSFVINGDNNFCITSNNYTISSLPAGAIVTWTATPSNIVTINSPNSPQTTLTRNSNGVITLTANISNACGGTITITKENIMVGVPAAPIITNLNFDSRCGSFMEAYSSNPAGATGYVWNLNFGQVVQDDVSDYIYVNPLINSPQTGQSYYNYISVQAKNVCGLSDPSATKQFTVGPVPSSCGSGGTCGTGCGNCCPILLRVSPNPSVANMRVETTNGSSFTKLRIIDKMGNVRKELTYPAGTKKATLRIGDLPSDLYRLQATDGKNQTTVSFSKQ